MMNDEELFGSPDNCVITGWEKELDKVFREDRFASERFEFALIKKNLREHVVKVIQMMMK